MTEATRATWDTHVDDLASYDILIIVADLSTS